MSADKRTKVTIIDVAFGDDIRSIIADDLGTITAKNQSDIDAAIAESRQLNQVREGRQQVAQALIIKTEAAFEAINAADARGETMAATDLLALVQPEITSMNSLVQRLKALLKSRNDPRKLANMRSEGATYYYLADSEG
jgi:hypothetical protein